ncbi:hypothetical protein TBR22_A32820 [Luteitalea sp. TBR-22]|uniref:transporter n=1 Tax=Luteitalea sp. TBR-22 TaxID=2802971 RepID=UPI001AF2D392|nr:transporter [Luteitalea sp. TBR-22]BCS34053.1 hypothetical protein TBR22_A32820 [Luteitalea sp. TBR-22]
MSVSTYVRTAPAMRSGACALLGLLLCTPSARAQDLDPRAYARAPVDATFLVTGFSVSHGGVVSDASLPLTDIDATVVTPSVGVARSFGLFGQTAQAFVALPYSWARVSGNLAGEARQTTRSGLSDMRFRLSVLLRGAPAASMQQIATAPRRTILGASVTVVAPTGQFFPEKLINLGTNRWTVKPEFAVSQPLGKRWLLDTYAALWMFTANESFYPGTSVRTQSPIAAFQAHISYSVRPLTWAAFDATYYVGGRTTIQGVTNDDRQSNSRIGATLALPVGRRHSVKLAVSRGAIIRYGADFSTISLGWQTAWAPMPKPTRSATGVSHGAGNDTRWTVR